MHAALFGAVMLVFFVLDGISRPDSHANYCKRSDWTFARAAIP